MANKKYSGLPAKNKFGTSEEIANRVGGTFKTKPESVPSHFTQIGPDGGGARPEGLSPKAVSGRNKFGNPRRYV